MIKKFLIFATALTTLLSATACADSSLTFDQPNKYITISFSWWGNDDRNEYTLAAIKKFEQENPGIKVDCNYSEWSGYQSRYQIEMASNTESDVMQINYAWLQQYSPEGDGYYDLSQLSDAFDFSNFSEDQLEYGTVNGKLNAIPIAMNTMSIYINKTVYTEYGLDVPKTFDDYMNAAKVMNGEVYPLSTNAYKSVMFYLVSYVEQKEGKNIIDEYNKLNFTRYDFQDMIEYYKELIENKVMPHIENYEKTDVENGKVAGCLAWVSDAENYCQSATDNGYEMVVTDYPSIDGSTVKWYTKPATMYAISDKTEYPEESAKLLDFLINSDEMAELQGIEKGIPLSKSAQLYLGKTNVLQGIQYEAFNVMNEHSTELQLMSPYMETSSFYDTLQQVCNDYYFGKMSIDDGADVLYKAYKDVLGV